VTAKLKVVIAEDLALLRDGLIRLLTANGFDVVEAVDNGPSLLRALVTHRPDVAVVDVRLPPSFTDEGLRFAIEAREKVPGLPVLVLPSTSSSSTHGNFWGTAAAPSDTC
jgi:DNA-binding NarL/FixJ family response regulator